VRPVAGGDINQAYSVDLGDGGRAFVKTRPSAEPGEYEAEAAGLAWLREGPVRVPEVLGVGSEPPFLALRWVEPGRLSPAGVERLGRGLAELHALGAPAHAWLPGGASRQRLGSLGLGATPDDDWPRVYAEQRLRPLARIALERGSLSGSGADAVLAVCDRIGDLAGPREHPARLHGDLWAGNVHAGPDGEGWLIDPSAQGGHRELDLAMLRLFGAPGGEALFAAYEEVAPLAPGHRERVPLWQLQPLLVHAVLFGGHYGAAAERAARAYL
jgi:fructosamine-3-kinase